MTVAKRSSNISLAGMTEFDAERLMALLIGSVNWARNPWAKDIYDALEEIGIDPTDDQCDMVRGEVQRYLSQTEDNSPDVLVGDVPVLDEDEDDYP